MSISTSTSAVRPAADATVADYLRNHALHAVTVLAFVVYPAVYYLLTGTFGMAAQMILPNITTMIAVLYLGLFTMSFDFVSGYTGYLSFGHAAFFGTGAYVVILGANGKLPFVPSDLPFVLLLVVAALLAVVLALLVGLVSFRLSGVYFAMITLGFAEVIFVLAENWDYLTRGSASPRDGIAASRQFEIGVPYVGELSAAIGGFGDSFGLSVFGTELFVLGPRLVSFYLIGLFVLLSYLAMQRIVHSPFGRVMIAIRENEQRAKAVGYDTFRYKLVAFLISAFFAGIAGGLLAGYHGSANPTEAFYFLVTGFALIAAIIGGLGTLAGALLGYVFLEAIMEFLAPASQGGGLQPFLAGALPPGVLETEIAGLSVAGALDAFMTGHGEFYAGLIFVVFVLYVPDGLVGALRDRYGGPLAPLVADRLRGVLDGRLPGR